MPLTLDANTRAAASGKFCPSRLKYFLSYPKWGTIWAACLLVALGLTTFVSIWLLILAGPVLLWNWLYWRRVKEHFVAGSVNPAVVVHRNPWLVAVHTQLSVSRMFSHPAIKVMQAPLDRCEAGAPKVGQRVVAISLFMDQGVRGDSWDDCDPRVVNTVTGNRETIEGVMARIQRREWRELELGLHQVPTPYKPGLYRLDVN